jgi:hypothetical protein
VQRARDQLFAGPRLAGDHHGEIGLHQAGEHAVDFLHRRRTADEGDRFKVVRLGGRARAFLRLRQRAPYDADQLLEIERLRQVFVGTSLGRPHRRHERVLRAHNDHGKLRPQLLDAG